MKLSTLFLFCLLSSFSLMAQTDKAKASLEEPREIFTVVETMPEFPGCEDIKNRKKRKTCADKEMLQFVYRNLKYPEEARENETEGTVIVRFFIDEEGVVNEATISKDIGDGCGDEALRVVNSMPDWHPGTQRGIPVKVYINLPVRFRL